MEEKKMNSQQIEGRNAVMEAFRSGKPIDKVYILEMLLPNNFLTTVIYIVQKQVPERHLFSLHIHRCYFV